MPFLLDLIKTDTLLELNSNYDIIDFIIKQKTGLNL